MSEAVVKDESKGQVKAVSMAELSASIHQQYLDGEDVVDHVVVLTPRSDNAYAALAVMLALSRRGKGTAFIRKAGQGGAEIVVRTKPHWEDA